MVYLLILAGGIVRATGSGMGCPDWPKCFGQWVPPTHESQLPPDYQTRYATAHIGVEPFNAAKTWTEYLNRLLGAITGLLVVGVFLASLSLRRTDGLLTWVAGAVVVLVGLQAWLGKLVVERNLHGGTVTLHMLLALLIVGLLIWVAQRPLRVQLAAFAPLPLALAWGCVALDGVQVALGTQVREAVDVVAATATDRSEWLQVVGGRFSVHRSFSILVLGAAIVQCVAVWPHRHHRPMAGYLVASVGTLGLALGLGLVLAYGDLPTWAQPMHLVVGTLLVGVHLFGAVAVTTVYATKRTLQA